VFVLLIVNGSFGVVMQMRFAFVFIWFGFLFGGCRFFYFQLLLVVSPFPLWHMFNKILFRVKQII